MKRLFALMLALVMLPLMVAESVAQGYQVRPGDTLRVEVLEDSTLNRETLVAPDGRISLPIAGSIMAAGRTIPQIEAAVTQQLQPGFAAPPTVFVSLGGLGQEAQSWQKLTVHVIGEANRPGPIEIDRGSTILQAFAAMGGFTRFAAVQRVQLRRVDPNGVERVYSINFRAVERGEIGAGTVTLRDGDVIVIPQRRLFE